MGGCRVLVIRLVDGNRFDARLGLKHFTVHVTTNKTTFLTCDVQKAKVSRYYRHTESLLNNCFIAYAVLGLLGTRGYIKIEVGRMV